MNSAAVGLCVDQVHVWRGDRHVLKGVSLEVRPRELLHVAGPNGAGKTTLLRVATGLLRPEQGSVAWFGQSITQVQSEYQSALAYASHETALKGDLTALENLRFMVRMKRRAHAHRNCAGVSTAPASPAVPICRSGYCPPASAAVW